MSPLWDAILSGDGETLEISEFLARVEWVENTAIVSVLVHLLQEFERIY